MQLVEWMRRKHVSQRQLAETLGVAASTLCRILSGERNPSVRLMRRIQEATGGAVTPTDLVEATPGETPKEAA